MITINHYNNPINKPWFLTTNQPPTSCEDCHLTIQNWQKNEDLEWSVFLPSQMVSQIPAVYGDLEWLMEWLIGVPSQSKWRFGMEKRNPTRILSLASPFSSVTRARSTH